jgi:photoactive yellow protein
MRLPAHVDEVQEIDLPRLSPADFDALPFGVIQLDEAGVVLLFNAKEAELARRSPEEVLGKNFFEDVAPCTNVRDFRGRFDTLLERGLSSEAFEYRFRFPWGARDVQIRLLAVDGSRWVLVNEKKTGGEASR